MRCLHITTTANYNNCPAIILLLKRLFKPSVYLTSYTTTVFKRRSRSTYCYDVSGSLILYSSGGV